MSSQGIPTLSLLEARILGVLAEKQLTTPDYYPLTLNALVAGCNQKTSRNPTLSASDEEVQMALDSLRRHTLVIDSYGASGRVMRYAHNIGKVLGLPQPSVALLAVLMLRGPQTAGELRTNCERLHQFSDISTVEGYLEEMAARSQGPLTLRLAKQPGSREHRYAHLLCGTPAAEAAPAAGAVGEDAVTTGELAALKANVAELRGEVAELTRLVQRVYAELGIARE